MQTTTRRRLLIAASAVTVLALTLVTLWGNPGFLVKPDKVDTAKQQEDFQVKMAKYREDYRQALLAEKADPAASREVLEKIITEKDVYDMAVEELQLNQKIVIPEIKIDPQNVIDTKDEQKIRGYFQKHFEEKKQFTERTHSASLNLYHDTAPEELITKALADTQSYISLLKSEQVPRVALEYHKAVLGAMQSYESFIVTAIKYYEGSMEKPWPIVYRDWMISNEFANRATTQIKELQKQYAVSEIYADVYGQEAPWLVKIGVVNQAEAFALFGGIINFEIGNLWTEINNVIATGLSKFINTLLNRIIQKIEQSFQISNYLYYADALVTGQYADNFLDKYLGDCVPIGQTISGTTGPVITAGGEPPCERQGGLDVGDLANSSLTKTIDKQMIKAFMPQYNCGTVDRDKIAPILKQRAEEYIGVDLSQPLDVNRADFYDIVNRVNHVAADAIGQELLAKDAAQVTTKQLSETITRELLGSGKKAGRSKTDASPPIIKLSVDGVENAQLATLVGNVLLGTDKAQITITISSLVKTVLSSFLNSFIFASAQYVLKEQDRKACLTGIPVAQALVPVEIPNEGPDIIDNEYIQRCRANPEVCAQGFIDAGDISSGGGLPIVPDRVLPVGGDGLVMDKVCYAVGEVPRLAIRGSVPGELIYWTLIRQPFGQPVYVDVNFEDAAGPQMTDAQGNWPSATGSVPDQAALTAGDIGNWSRFARVDGRDHLFEYRVVATRNDCLAAR